MANFPKSHGLEIAQNGYIKNLVAESFDSTAESSFIPTEAGRVFYSVADKCFKITRAKSDNSGFEAVKLTTGDISNILQTEVDAIETSLGGLISSTGAYVPFTNGYLLNGNTSITEDLQDLDAAIYFESVNRGNAITAEQEARIANDINIQGELDAAEAGAGLETNGAYVADSSSNYIKTATSLKDADTKLDAQIKTVADNLAALGTGSLTNLQNEVNSLESSIGDAIAADGTYVAFTGKNYINGNTSVTEDITDLDSAIKANADAIATEVSDRTTAISGEATARGQADSNIQAELDAAEAAIGLATDGTYVAFTGKNYINGNTSIVEDLSDLDAAIKANSDSGSAAQSELDALETSLGSVVSTTGTYVAFTGKNYINGNTSVTEDITDLDSAIKANADAITAEATARGQADSNIQAELDAAEAAIGLATDGTYVAFAGKNYISGNASIVEDLSDLDAAVKTVADSVTNLGTGAVSAVQSELDTLESSIGSMVAADGTYVAFTGKNYINGNASVTDDIVALDTALKSARDIADAALPKAGGTMVDSSSHINMNGAKVTNLGDCTSPADAATKAYVDALAQGLSPKAAVIVATTAPITLSGEQTIDGVALLAGDRVLVKNQANAVQNGIYVVSTDAWTRAGDADGSPVGEVVKGMYTFVEEGDTLQNTGWFLTTGNPITVGTDELEFAQFSHAGLVTPGVGLSKVGNVLNVNLGAGIAEGPSDEVAIDVYANKGLILTEDGSSSSSASAAKIAIKLEDGSLEFGASGGLKVSGSNTSALQGELDTAEASIGLAADGTLVAFTGANYISVSTTIASAISTLDSQAKTNADAIASEASTRGVADTAIQAELDAAEAAIGLAANGTYVAFVGKNYISGNTSIVEDLSDLDAQLKVVADASVAAQSELDTLEVALGSAFNSNGTYVPFTTSNYINGATTLTGVLSTLDSQAKTNADAITALGTSTTNNLVAKSAYNATMFTFDSVSGSGPSTQHVVLHNLGSSFIEVMVWVKDDDGSYKNDLVGITVNSNNQITIDLTESRDVRAVVRSAVTFS